MNPDPSTVRNAIAQQDEPNDDDDGAAVEDVDAAVALIDENGVEALEDDIEL